MNGTTFKLETYVNKAEVTKQDELTVKHEQDARSVLQHCDHKTCSHFFSTENINRVV